VVEALSIALLARAALGQFEVGGRHLSFRALHQPNRAVLTVAYCVHMRDSPKGASEFEKCIGGEKMVELLL
jgi:hypothetical protein